MAIFHQSSSRLTRAVIPVSKYSIASRSIQSSTLHFHKSITGQHNAYYPQKSCRNAMPYTTFSKSSSFLKGITPDSSDPTPPTNAPAPDSATKPVEMSRDEYATFSAEYLERLADRLDQLAETKDNIEVESGAGVISVSLAGRGSYSINTHAASKQIWWSSPISGPKRFDYVVLGDSMGEKADMAEGAWVYMKDGTRLEDLVLSEFGVDMTIGIMD